MDRRNKNRRKRSRENGAETGKLDPMLDSLLWADLRSICDSCNGSLRSVARINRRSFRRGTAPLSALNALICDAT